MNQHDYLMQQILSDTFIVYMKSLHTHWNMQDERFYFLHRMVEEQHKELLEFIDLIAERIRQKGLFAPKSLKEILSLKSQEETHQIESGTQMLLNLKNSYEKLSIATLNFIEICGKDYVTQDIMIEFSRFIDKTIWILKSHLN